MGKCKMYPLGLWLGSETLAELNRLRGQIPRNRYIRQLVEIEIKEKRLAKQYIRELNDVLRGDVDDIGKGNSNEMTDEVLDTISRGR
jgi:hypothetical protein